MAVFVFKGDPSGRGDPPACEMFGLVFVKGEEVEVEDEALASKLRGNSHFAEIGGSAPVVKRGPGRPRKQPQEETVDENGE